MSSKGAEKIAETLGGSIGFWRELLIFGTGFAPFRGGPIQYAKERGVNNIIETLKTLENKYGDRFKPSIGWKMISQIEGKD